MEGEAEGAFDLWKARKEKEGTKDGGGGEYIYSGLGILSAVESSGGSEEVSEGHGEEKVKNR